MRGSLLALGLGLGLGLASWLLVSSAPDPSKVAPPAGARAAASAPGAPVALVASTAPAASAPGHPAHDDEPLEDENLTDEAREHDHLHPHEAWRAPLTWPCRGERAYAATALSFSAPTPEKLARALDEATRKGGAFALVIQRKGDDFRVALSAAERTEAGGYAFSGVQKPSFRRLVDGFGAPPGVSSDQFQPRGYLAVGGKTGTSWLELRRVNWRAVEGKSCDEVEVHAYASLSAAQQDLFLQQGPRLGSVPGSKAPRRPPSQATRAGADPTSSGSVSVPPEPPEPPVPLHFSFKATAVAFAPPTP